MNSARMFATMEWTGGAQTPRSVATPGERHDMAKRTRKRTCDRCDRKFSPQGYGSHRAACGVPCSIDGCDGGACKRGWCEKHYQRWKAHGDPLTTRWAPRGAGERWLARHLKSEPTDECVEWPYGTRAGYGIMFVDGMARQVTHLVLDGVGRPRPPAPNDWALHSCDNPPCVNPAHLRWGSQDDNMRDMVKRRRDGRSVLTPAQVREIRSRHAAGGVTYEALADEFGVTGHTISCAVRRVTWKHIGSESGGDA